MDTTSVIERVEADGWTLLVLTHGGYDRDGGDYVTEIFWVINRLRVNPELARFDHAGRKESLLFHQRIMTDLEAGRYELRFGRGIVTLNRVSFWKELVISLASWIQEFRSPELTAGR